MSLIDEINEQNERQPYVYEALGLTEYRTDELMKIVFEELEAEIPITDSLLKFQTMTNVSENERTFLIFTFGYYIYELDLYNQMIATIEDELGDDDLTSDMVHAIFKEVNRDESLEDFHADIFRDVA